MAGTPPRPPVRPDPPQLTDSRKQRIYKRLLLIGQGPADFYLDFCLLLEQPWLRTSSHTAAHFLREIESAVREVLVPADFKKPESGGHTASINAALASLGLADDKALGELWRRIASGDPLHSRAHRDNLAQARPLDNEARVYFASVETLFDRLLERVEVKFLDFVSTIDALLDTDSPSATHVERLIKKVPNNPTTLAHFFEKASDPRWLPLLAEKGYFRYPPEPLRNEAAGTISFPWWPQSRYLVRMAGIRELDEQVAEIALRIPSSDNSSLAARFVPRTKDALATPYMSLIQLKVGELAEKLAKGGRHAEAVDLLNSLLTPSAAGETNRVRWPGGDWAVEEVLKRNAGPIAQVVGPEVLRGLCGGLAAALRIQHPTGSADHSRIWRHAIEPHSEDRHTYHDVDGHLVDAIRDAAVALSSGGQEVAGVVAGVLNEFDWSIFNRVALHVLCEMENPSLEYIEKRLHDRTSGQDIRTLDLLGRSGGAASEE